jgi:phosphatidylglycerol:prolipoprotein diacylglycerol transferase
LLQFPNIDPEIFSIELMGYHFSLRWYALAYIIGFFVALYIMKYFVKKRFLWRAKVPPMEVEATDRILTYLIFGVILGGRIGYVLFYNLRYYADHPLDILRLWDGGMSFHGGFLGVIVAGAIFCYLNSCNILSAADLISLATPPGLFLGRLANFANAELWGASTELPWGVIFPGIRAQDCPGIVGACARHPTQVYEAVLEGLLLLIILLIMAHKGCLKKPGLISGCFILGYGISRFLVEFFRTPDPQFFTEDNKLGFAYQWGEYGFTMGQALSAPMIFCGIILIFFALLRSRLNH